jgi:protease-4
MLAGGQHGTGAPVALVRASGSISMAGGGGLFGGSGGITAKAMERTLRTLENDEDVRAVVLRIDSPGGSALASDLIWHRLMKLRDKKPLVVSVGDMAASGGYYMACAGTVIVAEPTSIVGSIGVVGGKVAADRALELVGVHAETFPANAKSPNAAARAGYNSPLIEWDDATRGRVLESMTSVYDLFLARIAEGRKTTPDKIAPNAEGRIFSGTEGKARGLVDELGGLGDAIARARELAHLPADARVDAVSASRPLLDSLGAGGSDDGEEGESEKAPSLGSPPRAIDLVTDVAPDLAPFVGSFLPLARGERAVAAVPYAILIR